MHLISRPSTSSPSRRFAFAVAAASLLLAPIASVHAALRKFTLNLGYKTVAPDGFSQELILANGVLDYPIVVDSGDDLEITVVNNLKVATSLHWHGLFQRGTPWMDGAGMVTQCPIQPGDTFVYKFSTGANVGTYWWHAHMLAHYTGGLRGPFIIRDKREPFAGQYDVDQTITLTDTFHNTTAFLMDYYFAPGNNAFDPVPESGLINGVGSYDCSRAPRGSKCVKKDPYTLTVTKGKKYRFRLINTSAESGFLFSIDGHNMTVVESDGVYTTPTVVNALPISSSQRYSIIVDTTGQKVDNYWMRATIDTNLWNPAPTDLNGLNPNVVGVVRYSGAKAVLPSTNATVDNVLNPYTLGELNGRTRDSFPDSWDQELYMTYFIGVDDRNISQATVSIGDNVNESQYKMPSYPTLLDAIAGANYSASANVVPVGNGTYVFLQISNDDPMEHVFHLHGHTFWVLQAGHLLHAPVTTVGLPRRDAIQVPACVGGTGGGGEQGCRRGYVALAIYFDNPGAWLFHCHIEWHMQAGLAFTFVNSEGLSRLARNIPPSVQGKCKKPSTSTPTPTPSATRTTSSAKATSTCSKSGYLLRRGGSSGTC